MRNLISAQEVIDLAFAESSNMREDSISATSISVAEIKYIRPAFGAMFPLLGEKYADFTNEYVKPALAYFVKCEIIASIAIDMSNSGVAVANPQYQSAATDKQRQRLYDSEMSKAKTLLDFALEYIATHSEEFPDFSGTAPKKHYRLGGLILGNGGGSRSQSASIAGDAFKEEFDKYIKDMQAITEALGKKVDKTDYQQDKETTAQNLSNKVDKISGKGLSSNDYSDSDKALVEQIANKADTDGYYPAMTVGKAENLVGRGESTEEEFSFRPSAGSLSIEDGTAKLTSIKGNSVVWNQQFGGGVIDIDLDNSQGDSVLSKGYYNDQYTFNICANHIYFCCANPQIDNENVTILYGNINTTSIDIKKPVLITAPLDKLGFVSIRVPAGQSVKGSIRPQCIDLTQMFGAGNEPKTVEEYLQRKPMNIADEFAYNTGTLVDMRVNEIKSVGFNAWDEKWELGVLSTITGEDVAATDKWRAKNFIKILPNSTYSFTLPTNNSSCALWALLYDDQKKVIPIETYSFSSGLKSLNAFKVVVNKGEFTTPANAKYIRFYAPSEYGSSTYRNDISLHLVQSGYKNGMYAPYEEDTKDLSWINVYFPNGMRSAGSVCDEIRYDKATQKWQKVKRVDEVNLWQMNWVYDANKGRNRTNDSILNIKVPIGASTKANILTALYEAQSLNGTYLKNVGIAIDTTGKVWVYDDAYTGSEDVVAQFVSMLTQQKAVLYYELAEPEITDLDIDLTPYYDIWDFGTEEAFASGASTPFRADIVYQFNAVDRIRNNSAKIEELGTKINKNTADIATKQNTLTLSVKDNGNIVIGNFVNNQSKEFMPATPSGVPEHYTWLKYNGVTYGTFTGADGNTYGQEGKWGVYAERGGLADLTNEDMRQVIVDSRQLATNNNAVQSCILARTNLIANANSLLISGYSFYSFLRASTKLEIANLILYSSSDAYFEPSNISQMFMGCTMLHTVLGTIGGRYLTNTTNCFIGCPALKEVRISGLKTSISFASSPYLSYESVLYMLENSDEGATPQIIITLHPTAYDRILEYDQSEDNPTAGDLMGYLGAYNHIDIARG